MSLADSIKRNSYSFLSLSLLNGIITFSVGPKATNATRCLDPPHALPRALPPPALRPRGEEVKPRGSEREARGTEEACEARMSRSLHASEQRGERPRPRPGHEAAFPRTWSRAPCMASLRAVCSPRPRSLVGESRLRGCLHGVRARFRVASRRYRLDSS